MKLWIGLDESDRTYVLTDAEATEHGPPDRMVAVDVPDRMWRRYETARRRTEAVYVRLLRAGGYREGEHRRVEPCESFDADWLDFECRECGWRFAAHRVVPWLEESA